jgi:hypothetical protein
VVSVHSTRPKGHEFKLNQGDGFLRGIKISSTPFFRWEVKPEVPCLKILRHVKHPLTYLRYWYAKFSILRPFLLLAPRCICWYDYQRALVDEPGVIPSRHRHHHGSPCSHITRGWIIGPLVAAVQRRLTPSTRSMNHFPFPFTSLFISGATFVLPYRVGAFGLQKRIIYRGIIILSLLAPAWR